MIPFPGESIAIFDAAHIVGGVVDWSAGGDLMYRGGYYPTDAGHITISGGDELRAWVGSGNQRYLETGSDAVVSWVLEVTSGTATIHASEGIDPDYGDPYLAPTADLGTFTVTGPATLVIPSTFTTTEVINEADADISLMLVCEVTAGSAVVQQVKLRVWPPDGAAGGWVPQPAWSETALGRLAVGSVTTTSDDGFRYNSATLPSPSDAWGDLESGLPSALAYDVEHQSFTIETSTSLDEFTPVDGFASLSMMVNGLGFYVAEVASDRPAFVYYGPASLDGYSPIESSLVDGVDYIVPPNEVQGDIPAVALTGGSKSWAWNLAPMTVTMSQTGVFDEGDMYLNTFTAPYDPLLATMPSTGVAPPYTAEPSGAAFIGPHGDGITVEGGFEAPGGDDVSPVIWVEFGATILKTLPYFGDKTPSVLFPFLVNYDFHVYASPPRAVISYPTYQVWSPTIARRAPHLIFDRSDDLGAGAALVYGRDTRQSSGLVFGNY